MQAAKLCFLNSSKNNLRRPITNITYACGLQLRQISLKRHIFYDISLECLFILVHDNKDHFV